MGGEDFSFMALKVPGCFVRIGQRGAEKGRVPVHHPLYDFNDDILPIGASFWATLVEHAPTAVSMTDRDLRVLKVSRRWREERGLQADDVIGRG